MTSTKRKFQNYLVERLEFSIFAPVKKKGLLPKSPNIDASKNHSTYETAEVYIIYYVQHHNHVADLLPAVG